jgi:hypothetical protein
VAEVQSLPVFLFLADTDYFFQTMYILWNRKMVSRGLTAGGAEMDLMMELEDARWQWKNMQNIYNEVSDPALIDSVIYQVMAAEQRYEYLLRLAKSESLTCENIPVR